MIMDELYEFTLAGDEGTILVRGRLMTDEDNYRVYRKDGSFYVVPKARVNYYKVG
jgi:ethanolamine utilization protein EutQ (cupin superfamily)